MHWAVLRVSIMFRNSIPVFVQYHLLISLDSVQVRFLAHPKTTSLALAHVHNMATLALKLSGRSLLYSKSASFPTLTALRDIIQGLPDTTVCQQLTKGDQVLTKYAGQTKYSYRVRRADQVLSGAPAFSGAPALRTIFLQ